MYNSCKRAFILKEVHRFLDLERKGEIENFVLRECDNLEFWKVLKEEGNIYNKKRSWHWPKIARYGSPSALKTLLDSRDKLLIHVDEPSEGGEAYPIFYGVLDNDYPEMINYVFDTLKKEDLEKVNLRWCYTNYVQRTLEELEQRAIIVKYNRLKELVNEKS